MATLAPTQILTPQDVERAAELDGKLYELVDGELREKVVGFSSLVIAAQIVSFLNARFFPNDGAAAAEVPIYCFGRPNHGRKPDVAYVSRAHWPGGQMPQGDLHFAPDLVVEVLSPSNGGMEVDGKLDEYLAAGIGLVWIVNPEKRTIRVYRSDGTTRVYRERDVIENEPLLPGFRLVVGDVFPNEPLQSQKQ